MSLPIIHLNKKYIKLCLICKIYFLSIYLKMESIQKYSTHSIRMRSVLMLGPVRGIAEGFRTARKLAHVRPLSRVRSEMSLQILQPRVRL